MCEICAKRKGDVALFLSEHGPQLGIKSERALQVWSDLTVLAVEVSTRNAGPADAAAQEEFSDRGTKIMQALSLSELEEIFFAATSIWMTGNLHRLNASGMLKARWRAGERDPKLSAEAIQSIEESISQEDASRNVQRAIVGALTQALDAKITSPPVTVFVPGNGKPVPPS